MERIVFREGIVMLIITQSPFSPQAPHNPPVNLPGAIRHYLKARKIWQTIESRFALNDDVSRQVRTDTVRFGIQERFRMGL